MKIGKGAMALLGLVLLAIILSRINVTSVVSVLSRTDPVLYLLSVAITFSTLLLKGFKWKLLLESVGVKVGTLCATKICVIGLAMSNVTPGKLGDFARALYIREKAELPTGLATVFMDRVIDVGLLVFAVVLASAALSATSHLIVVPLWAIALIVLAFAAGVFFLARDKYLKVLLKPAFLLLVPEKYKEKVSRLYAGFFLALKLAAGKPKLLAAAAGAGLLLWGMNALAFYLQSVSLSMNAPMLFMVLVFPIMALTDILPISFAGIGTRETALIFMLSFLAISAESAVALSFMVFFTGYFLVSLLGLAAFMLEPIKLEL